MNNILLVILCFSFVGGETDFFTAIDNFIGKVFDEVESSITSIVTYFEDLFYPQNPDAITYNTFDLAKAISSFVEEVFSKMTSSVDLISIGTNQYFSRQVINNIISQSNKRIAFQILDCDDEQTMDYELKKPTVFLIESVVNCSEFLMSGFTKSAEQQKLKFLVFCHSARKEHIENFYFKESDQRYQEMSFLIFEGSLFTLYAFRYDDKLVTSRYLEEINTFSKSLSKWNTDKFFPDPITDFENHEMRFSIKGYTSSQKLEIDMTVTNAKDQIKCIGFNVMILEEIARTLNFAFECQPMVGDEKKKSYLKTHILLEYKPINRIKMDYFMLPTYESTNIIYLVPPGESYTGFEKLILAFDTDTWTWIGITFAIAYFTILIVSFSPRKLQRIVFGSGVNTPCLNIIVAFFGLGQMTLPRKSFARFLLMSFILFSMIIRTAYQGVSFELLQSRVTKKRIQSMDEALDMNYTVFAAPDVFLYSNETPEELGFINKSYDTLPFENIATNASSRAVAVLPQAYLKELNRILKGKVELHVLSETFNSAPMVMMFPKTSILFKPLNKVLEKFIEAGIVDHIIKTFNEKDHIPAQEDGGPAILTIQTLQASFEVWFYSVIVSAFAFITEILFFHRTKVVEFILTPIALLNTELIIANFLSSSGSIH